MNTAWPDPVDPETYIYQDTSSCQNCMGSSMWKRFFDIKWETTNVKSRKIRLAGSGNVLLAAPVFYSWLSEFSANKRRRYICNVFSNWLRHSSDRYDGLKTGFEQPMTELDHAYTHHKASMRILKRLKCDFPRSWLCMQYCWLVPRSLASWMMSSCWNIWSVPTERLSLTHWSRDKMAAMLQTTF